MDGVVILRTQGYLKDKNRKEMIEFPNGLQNWQVSSMVLAQPFWLHLSLFVWHYPASDWISLLNRHVAYNGCHAGHLFRVTPSQGPA